MLFGSTLVMVLVHGQILLGDQEPSVSGMALLLGNARLGAMISPVLISHRK